MPDLTDIPGISELWAQTQGDSRITIAILDGPVDLERTCFAKANLTKIEPYWQQDIEVDPKYLKAFLAVVNSEEDDETKGSKLEATVPSPIRERLHISFHATHISSTIFGQHGSPVKGIAPNCRGINIPIAFDHDNFISPLNLSRAINLALDSGANIIHVAVCQPTQTGEAHDLVTRVVEQCQENNVLIVAPAGNDGGECWCIPAVLPDVLTVGAMKDSGEPFKFSNWKGRYQTQGVLAPGENVLGAQPGTDEPVRKKGTSCAAPIVTGVAALLLSLQLKRGEQPDPEAVRAAILNSAIPCDPKEIEEPERCLMGKLNVPGAVKLLTGEPLPTMAASGFGAGRAAEAREMPNFMQPVGEIPEATVAVSSATPEYFPSSLEISLVPSNVATTITASHPTDTITASARSNLVYVLGVLGYDFGTEARRDSFKQLMPNVRSDTGEAIVPNEPLPDGVAPVPPTPQDARQMADYLENNLSEAKSLMWTLNLELTPIYALEPVGPFAANVYESLQQLLAGQVEAEDSEDYIERVSIPGRLTDRTVKLFSGQVVPVIELHNKRGLYGWNVNTLVSAALEAVRSEQEAAVDEEQEEQMRPFIRSFLNHVYYDLRNLGQTSPDRALNFAATNPLQLAQVSAEAAKERMELDSIEVEKSPFCRLDSDCWDVKLKLFDPENSRRARKVYRYTIDVSDIMPVTLGKVHSWSTSN